MCQFTRKGVYFSPTKSPSRRPRGDSLRRIVAGVHTLSPFHTLASIVWSICYAPSMIVMSPRLQMPIVLCNRDTARENLKRLPQSHRHHRVLYSLHPFPFFFHHILSSSILTQRELESRSRHELIVKVRMAHDIVITEIMKNVPRLPLRLPFFRN